MKLLFFLVALVLVLLRAYFSFVGHDTPGDGNTGAMTITGDHYNEQIKWSGKVILNEDETAIASISPGGYIRFKENDAKLVAESNLQGEIAYSLFDGQQSLAINDSGKHFISACISKMIARGFNSEGRAERIKERGGYRALIKALSKLDMENVKGPYLDLLFTNDSLRNTELADVIKQTLSSVSDIDKENFLRRITAGQRRDSLVNAACMDVVSGINADIQKANLLGYFIDQDSLSNTAFDKTMEITSHFNADIDKENIYNKLVDKGKLAEQQWIQMIDAAGELNADIDKSNLLISIADKMPHTEQTKTAYLAAAKKINDDASYGRTVKVIE